MHRNLIVLTAVMAVAACNSTPIPTASPNPSPSGIASPIPSPTPSASPTASPSQSPTASVITEQVGLLTVTHPVAWRLVAGPKEILNRPIPLFYLSDAPLTVGPCPTPDPKSGEFQGCPEPLAALPSGGVLVTVNPNLGLPAMNPPQVTFENKTKPVPGHRWRSRDVVRRGRDGPHCLPARPRPGGPRSRGPSCHRLAEARRLTCRVQGASEEEVNISTDTTYCALT